MPSYLFMSPFFKCKDNKAYLLNKFNLNINNYYEDTYFIDIDEIKKKQIKINDITIGYKILYAEDDMNLLIKIDISNDLTDLEINKIVYIIELNILCINKIQNIDDETLKYYANKYIKI